MSRRTLIPVILLSATATAQTTAAERPVELGRVAAPLQEDPSAQTEEERAFLGLASIELGRAGTRTVAFRPGSNALLAQSTVQAQPRQPSPQILKGKGHTSKTGYIDNPIVGSQIRVRLDAGFRNEVPDRAEFFYAKCGCYRDLSGPAYDPAAPGPGPGIVTDLNFQQLYLDAEYAPTRRFSAFTEIPLRWIQPQAFAPSTGSFGSQRGLGDVRAGFKVAIATTSERHLTLQLRSYIPTGSAGRGLGTRHASLEPAMLYYQSLSERVALEFQVGHWHPIQGSAGLYPKANSGRFAGDVSFYGVGVSHRLLREPCFEFIPVVELVGWSVWNGFQTTTTPPAGAGGTNIVNLKLGARLEFGEHTSFYFGYGRALTDASWYNDIVRVEYRHSFGR